MRSTGTGAAAAGRGAGGATPARDISETPNEHRHGNGGCTRGECRARIAALQDEIAGIRAQIAAADLDRQARATHMDPRWFHGAKTALRHRRRELAELTAHMATLPPQAGPRDLFKDCLIEVLRADYDDDAWRQALTKAKRRQQERETG